MNEFWHEYELGESLEARFCKAIDKLEPIHHLHQSDYVISTGFTEGVLREKKEYVIKEFPEMLKMFNGLIAFWKTQGLP